jgi:hypothetical protein
MMQHPDRFDQVETAIHIAQLQQIALRIFDVQPSFAGLARGMGQAAEAEVHRQCACAREFPHSFDGIASRAATGNQDIEAIRIAGRLHRGMRKVLAQMVVEILWLGSAGPHPARIGIFLILLLHPPRVRIIDLGQARNIRAQASFFPWFAHLLGQNILDHTRP